jgi:hypothetical protein
MSHEIHLPHHGDITAPLSTALDAARSLPTDDARATARQIVIALAADGVGTVGEALEVLEHSSPAERRAMPDDARRAAGLPDMARVDRRRARQAEPIDDEPDRDEAGYAFQNCAICGVQPLARATGAPMRTRERRWHCAAHQDQAGPHDMEPWTNGLRFAAGGGLEDENDVEAEALAQRREAERHRLQHERRRAAAAAAALPGIERQAALEAASWRGANLMPEPEITA